MFRNTGSKEEVLMGYNNKSMEEIIREGLMMHSRERAVSENGCSVDLDLFAGLFAPTGYVRMIIRTYSFLTGT